MKKLKNEFKLEPVFNKPGRPSKKLLESRKRSASISKLTPFNIEKMASAYSIGATDAEVAVYLDVTIRTITNWRKKNPTLFLHLDGLKNRPILKARQEVVAGLEGNPEFALKYLERKKKDEFSLRTEITAKGGADLVNRYDIRFINATNNNSDKRLTANASEQSV